MADELALVHKGDLEDRRGMLSRATMREIDRALRRVLALDELDTPDPRVRRQPHPCCAGAREDPTASMRNAHRPGR